MSDMEQLIIAVALIASATGSLVLLGGLANKRAKLFQTHDMQQRLIEQEKIRQQKAIAEKEQEKKFRDSKPDPQVEEEAPATANA